MRNAPLPKPARNDAGRALFKPHFLSKDPGIMTGNRQATLYRMVLPDHVCPFGVRAKQMLEQAGYEVDDRILSTREEVDAFKAEQGVSTTPQIFIDGERIGGSDEMERLLATTEG
jgi:glutaredoxin